MRRPRTQLLDRLQLISHGSVLLLHTVFASIFVHNMFTPIRKTLKGCGAALLQQLQRRIDNSHVLLLLLVDRPVAGSIFIVHGSKTRKRRRCLIILSLVVALLVYLSFLMI